MYSTQYPNSSKEFTETQEEDGTDHNIRIEQETKEGADEFNTGGEAAMEVVNRIPKSELEDTGRWIINLTQKDGIVCCRYPGDKTQNPGEIQSVPRR